MVVAVRRQLEAEDLVGPREGERGRLSGRDHAAGERHVDDLGREREDDCRVRLPQSADDLDVAREPGRKALALGYRLPHGGDRIGDAALQAYTGERAFFDDRGVAAPHGPDITTAMSAHAGLSR